MTGAFTLCRGYEQAVHIIYLVMAQSLILQFDKGQLVFYTDPMFNPNTGNWEYPLRWGDRNAGNMAMINLYDHVYFLGADANGLVTVLTDLWLDGELISDEHALMAERH